MRAKTSTFSLLACIAVLALSTQAARGEVYGLDIVPGSHFHGEGWNFYGSDAVPTSSTRHNDFRTTYGWDAIPDTAHPHVYTRQNLLLIETVQRLTAAQENTPARNPNQRTTRFRNR